MVSSLVAICDIVGKVWHRDVNYNMGNMDPPSNDREVLAEFTPRYDAGYFQKVIFKWLRFFEKVNFRVFMIFSTCDFSGFFGIFRIFLLFRQDFPVLGRVFNLVWTYLADYWELGNKLSI